MTKNQMSINEKTFIKDEVVLEILKKAREDIDFKKQLFDNPQEALAQFGIKIPDGSLTTGLMERAVFFAWFYKSILNELKEETAQRQEDPNWHTKENYEFYWH